MPEILINTDVMEEPVLLHATYTAQFFSQRLILLVSLSSALNTQRSYQIH